MSVASDGRGLGLNKVNSASSGHVPHSLRIRACSATGSLVGRSQRRTCPVRQDKADRPMTLPTLDTADESIEQALTLRRHRMFPPVK